MNTSIPLPANGLGGFRLRVFATEDEAASRLAWLLGYAQTPPEITRCESLNDALDDAGTMPVLVPVIPAVDQIREALEAGAAPATALSDWCDRTTDFLQTCRQARRRIVLLDAAMMQAQPHELAADLGARLGEKLDLRTETPNLAPAPSASAYAALAACLVAGDPMATALADEIEAMTLGPVSSRLPARATLEAITTALRFESNEQRLMRDSLAQLLSTVTGLEKDLSTAQDESRATAKQLQEKTRQMQEKTTAMESLLHMKSRELVQVAAERARLAEEKAHLSGLLEGAHYEITALRESTSWKITRPLRALRGGSNEG
ncbi:hypothetical protein [Rhodobacter maris]|uniref:Uncharacterized protein n=1 Tax=Rhodobacter maris TaxID=446682 RepID=A0A285SG73_9RHOB|nr:hypothetical protein [Rhodobacter maris]SOC06932.1 hypothetical protein SAMN05877831_105181 [Rhodobacter maris]